MRACDAEHGRLLLVALVLSGALQAPSAAAEAAFSTKATVGNNQRLYVYGEELSGEIEFTFASGVLAVNGRIIVPPPQPASECVQPSLVTDERLLARYRNAPSVSVCLASGGTIRECVRAFIARKDSMIGAVAGRWSELRSALSEKPPPTSGVWQKLSDSALVCLDPEIVGDVAVARQLARISADGMMVVPLLGVTPSTVIVQIDSSARPPSRSSELLSEQTARGRVAEYLRPFSYSEPVLVLISRGGSLTSSGSKAEALFREIDALRADPNLRPTLLTASEACELRRFAQ